jgi:pimeloyl-ACP methyl ester carboxylesterase
MTSPPPPSLIPPLPWEWFEFVGNPRRFDSPAANTHAPLQTWTVPVDHRPVPFKLFRQGHGRPLLILLHGMGLTIASFRGISGYLFASHDLALIDYSSLSGTSRENAWPAGGVAIKVMADAVWKVADALQSDNFSLAGNSLGGGMCLIAALQRPGDPRLRKMLLSNPACYPQRLPKMYRLARIPLLGELLMTITPPEKLLGGVEYIGYVDKTRFDPLLRAHYARSMSQRKNRLRLMDMIRHLPANASDVTMAVHLGRLQEITQPVLVTWGEQEHLLAEDAGQRLARQLPHGHYAPYADLAHMPHEEAPERIGPLWAEFLNRGEIQKTE